MKRQLRVVGLSEPEASLLVTLLRDYGYEVVCAEGGSCTERAAAKMPLPLTPRHLEVLAAVRRSGSAQAAADALGISAKTVEAHLDHIYDRLGVKNRMQALCWACRRGLLPGACGEDGMPLGECAEAAA